MADDGGLFVPLEIPALDVTVEELSKMTYQQVAYEVMKLYFTDFTEEELKNCINNAYDSKFDTEEIAPLAEVEEHISLGIPWQDYCFQGYGFINFSTSSYNIS